MLLGPPIVDVFVERHFLFSLPGGTDTEIVTVLNLLLEFVRYLEEQKLEVDIEGEKIANEFTMTSHSQVGWS